MVTIDETWKSYQEYTQDLSNLLRQLAFAAAAICWFFKAPEMSFPTQIYWALICIVVFFFFDIAQYSLGAIIHRCLVERAENKIKKNGQEVTGKEKIKKSKKVDLPATICLALKAILILVTFTLILFYFIKNVNILTEHPISLGTPSSLYDKDR